MKGKNRIILLVVAAMLTIFTLGCSFNFSTAKIEDAIMTTSIDDNGMPSDAVTSYSADASALYSSAKILNAPDNTKIRIVWTFTTSGEQFDEATLDSGDISDRYIFASYEPSGPLPEGDYKVEYYVEDREEPDATVEFTVTAAANEAVAPTDGAYLEEMHMASYMEADGLPAEYITTVATTGTWYATAILRNTQPDTTIRFVWYDSQGYVIDDYALDPQGATDVYVAGTLTLNSAAPEGEYRVELYIDDATQPAGTIDFSVVNES